MKKIQYNGSSKIIIGIVTKVNAIIDKLIVDVKVNGTSVVVVNDEGEREADIDLSLADQNVKQSPTTSSDNSDYRVLLSKSANDTEETDISRKDTNLRYNPYSGELSTSKLRASNGYFYGVSVTELQTAQYYFQNGSSQVVAMLEANSASTASNPTMLYLPSTTGTLATLSDIPTVVDEKVKQTPENNSSSEFEVLLSGTADNTEHTEGAKKSSKLKFVPWNGSLKVGTLSSGFYNGSVEAGSIKGYEVGGIQLDAGDLSNKGTLSIYNNAGKAANVKFSNSATSDKSFEFPTVGGTIATLNDIPTITDTYDGTSPEGMSGIAVKNAIDALDVASTSIGAGETLATIKEEDGKIAVTTQDISIKSNQIENYCMVGTANAISSGVTWHKVASTTITITNDDAIIMFAVQDAYIPDTDSVSDSNGGFLYCRVRQGSPVGTFAYAKLKFVANSGLDVKNFRLYYTITSGTSITYEIWTSLSRQYAFRKFVVLSQSNRYQGAAEKWTLYNSTSPTSAPTESATCIRVDCEDNTYKQTDNDTLGATNLIPYPYSGGSNYVRNNVTISVNQNGVITATGSNPSSNFGYTVAGRTETIVLDPTKSYIMSGLTNGSSSTIRFLLDLWTENQNPVTDSYTTRLYQATTETVIPTGYKYLQISLYFYRSAGNLLPLTVSPMLRLASIADNTFKPYADTNRNLSMYKADLRLIADTEKTSTASRAYAVNELMFFDGNLYRVKTAIANGGAITVNTNVVATTLSAEIKAIRDALNI